MAREMYKCAICGKDANYSTNDGGRAYLERGISKKDFLCSTCYQKKLLVCDYSCDEKKRSTAVSYLEKKIVNKSITVQNVVNAWINGEDQYYYTSAASPVYYVEGPRARLFVFDDHVTILGSVFGSYSEEVTDYVYYYKCKAQVSARKTQEVKCFFAPYYDKYELSDAEKISAKLRTENYDSWEQQTMELNVSLGGYGSLDFGKKEFSWDVCAYSFSFYQHQNQLMEEIYNYIQSRIESPNAAPAQKTGNAKTKASKPTESYEKQSTEDSGASFSAADEIRKMKELLDCGIITQEEFDEAKKRLISKL